MHRALGVLVLAAALALGGPSARAQDETETAMARTLFEEGRAAAEAEDWTLAAERFRQTVALRDTPAVRYNLGTSLVELGQILAGIENLELAAADPTYAVAARELIASARERLARLVIEVPALGDWLVAIDDRPFPGALLGSEVPLDPGVHRVELLAADGALVAETEVTLEEGTSRHLALSAVSDPVSEPEPAQPFDEGPGTAALVGAIGTTLAGVALTITAVWSWTDTEAGIRRYVDSPAAASFAEANQRADRTELLGAFAAGTFVAGAVLWPLMATLLDRPDASAPDIAFAVDPTGGRLSVGGRW